IWICSLISISEVKYIMRHFIIVLLCALIISSCATPAEGFRQESTPTPFNMAFVDIPKPGTTPQASISQIIPTATDISNINILKVSIWVPLYLAETLGGTLPDPLRGLFAPEATTANVTLEVGEQNPVSQWVYALVTPFSSTIQGTSSDDLLLGWQGGSLGVFGNQPLLMDSNTYDMLSAIWGPAADGSVNVIAKNELLDYAWSHQPALAIIPFEALDPRWKVLPVDGLSPVHKDFDPASYRLKISISLNGDPQLVELLNADITHISNEVPFAVDCPYPNPTQTEIRFCSRDGYIQLLEDVGTDVVELTGDHFQDWGTEAIFHTLDMYRERGWLYYGGGANLAGGRKALLMENNANRIAFIGCNEKGGSFAQASETSPGAAVCDMDWMAGEISRLKQAGYLVIATFQHHEYYMYAAQPDQQQDFRQMAEAGAVIVSGSQAHQPQGMEFLNGSFIHYGLGNLFFDQYGLCGACRQGLIDHHVFYDGRYISTELSPIEFVDYARSRPMTLEEANSLFQNLFQVSGWQQ